MSRERNTTSPKNTLNLREYDIAGNRIRAYFDAKNELVFVIDETIDAIKPNVLLVVNPRGTRKWDDILSNDYGVNLETVRPRRDNKYQKLDIEYSGLGVYDALINAYESDKDLDTAVAALGVYRDTAARDAARARMASAETIAEHARETIEKTNASISELNSRIRELRSQLTQQRRNVGREPTKRSASKILRTESQIDAATEKLARARRRLTTAKRRLAAAAADSDVAREILARPAAVADMRDKNMAISDMRADEKPANIGAPQNTKVAKRKSAPVPASVPTQSKSDDTSDTDVKPLFDRDPNIMDSDIAFKPIEFDIPTPAPKQESPVLVDDNANAPAEFVVPVSFGDDEPVPESEGAAVADLPSESVLNSMRPVIVDDAPTTEDVADTDDTEPPAPILPTPVLSDDKQVTEYSRDDDMDVSPASVVNSDTNSEMPEISVATNASGFRPVSPITGGILSDMSSRRPTLVYYVMLFVLIILSIFTLWLYQRSGKNTTPNLVASAKTAPAVVSTVATTPIDIDDDADSPFIMGDADAEFMPAPSLEIVEPVTPSSADAPAPAVVTEPAPALEPVAETPAANDEMDVDAIEIETESVDTIADDDTDEPVMMDKPEYAVASTASVVTDAAQMCDDGTMPNSDGCCGAEVYSQMSDGAYACCTDDECFPPLN